MKRCTGKDVLIWLTVLLIYTAWCIVVQQIIE